jgi:hypothetical protein
MIERARRVVKTNAPHELDAKPLPEHGAQMRSGQQGPGF